MDEKELREKIKLKEKELINTNLGLIDILMVENDNVHLGFLATGRIKIETIDEFLKHMGVK